MALQIGTSEFGNVIREFLENEKLPELKDLAAHLFINVTGTKFTVQIGNPLCSLCYHSFSSLRWHTIEVNGVSLCPQTERHILSVPWQPEAHAN